MPYLEAMKVAPFAIAACGFIIARWLAQLWLDQLNQRHVRANAGAVPEAFRGVMDDATYAKSVEYTLANSRFSQFESTFDLLVLLAVLFSGVLPWAIQFCQAHLGASAWAMAVFLFVVFTALSFVSLPLQTSRQAYRNKPFQNQIKRH